MCIIMQQLTCFSVKCVLSCNNSNLMLNIGNPIETGVMARELHMNRRTVEKYLTIVQDACMFCRADRYDLRSTALSPTPKYYVVDPGLRSNDVGMASKDRGRVLENIVYLELRRRGCRINVGKYDSKEVDFVTEKTAGKPTGRSAPAMTATRRKPGNLRRCGRSGTPIPRRSS